MNGVGPIELLLGELTKMVRPHDVADVLEELRQSSLIEHFYINTAHNLVLVWPNHYRDIEAGLLVSDLSVQLPKINWRKPR
jgi:hypothetical protein